MVVIPENGVKQHFKPVFGKRATFGLSNISGLIPTSYPYTKALLSPGTQDRFRLGFLVADRPGCDPQEREFPSFQGVIGQLRPTVTVFAFTRSRFRFR